jgi:hypothetical protein
VEVAVDRAEAAAQLAVDRAAAEQAVAAATAVGTAAATAVGTAVGTAAATAVAAGTAGGIEVGFSGGHDLAAQDGILTHAFDVRRRRRAPQPVRPRNSPVTKALVHRMQACKAEV